MLLRLLNTGVILLFVGGSVTSLATPLEEWNVSGPEKCAECHRVEYGIWEETPHSLTYESMPDSDKGLEIGEALGLDDVVEAELCQTCHLTLQSEAEGELAEVIAGVSCDSCHGASVKWMEAHAKENKTPEEKKNLWAASEAAGMIRPGDVYTFAKNCLACHVVPQEKLVNTGGHAPGSEFNLVSWSQGVIRHNTFYSADNNAAAPERKRMMAVMGVAAELQIGLNAASAITDINGEYAQALIARLAKAKAALSEMADLTSAPRLQAIYASVADVDMTLPMDQTKTAATTAALATSAAALSAQGADLSALDALIESYGEYHGDPDA
jgi:hypothetical protein